MYVRSLLDTIEAIICIRVLIAIVAFKAIMVVTRITAIMVITAIMAIAATITLQHLHQLQPTRLIISNKAIHT